MWDLIVSVPDHYLPFSFECLGITFLLLNDDTSL